MKPNAAIPSLDATSFEKELVSFCLQFNIPFRAVDTPQFQNFMKYIAQDPGLLVPKRTKLRDLVHSQYEDQLLSLDSELRGVSKISLALDAWTSPNNLSFLAVNAYFITSSWEYKERLICFPLIKGSHSGENLADVLIESIPKAWRIFERLLCITADNASNNLTMAGALERHCYSLKRKWDPQQGMIPCIAHIIQLCVESIVSALRIELKISEPKDNQSDGEDDGDHQISFSNTLNKVCFNAFHLFLPLFIIKQQLTFSIVEKALYYSEAFTSAISIFQSISG